VTELSKPIVELNDVSFSWAGDTRPVLTIDDFSLQRGERLFLRGPSGSGKTTLLSLIAAVLSPQAGSILVDGIPLDSLEGGKRDQFRVDHIGLVFQQFNLLPFLSVEENVLLPCKFSKRRRRQVTSSGHSLSAEADRLLSAMKLNPDDVRLIIADEPTSALDEDTRHAFIKLLFAEVTAAECSLLFVSHDASLAEHFDRAVDLRELNSASTDFDELRLSVC